MVESKPVEVNDETENSKSKSEVEIEEDLSKEVTPEGIVVSGKTEDEVESKSKQLHNETMEVEPKDEVQNVPKEDDTISESNM